MAGDTSGRAAAPTSTSPGPRPYRAHLQHATGRPHGRRPPTATVMGMHIVATAGHVDHGKSTLLRALTGMEPDRWKEERQRGLTIDLGFVWTDLETPSGPVTVAFVDVPGHERFLPNMLAGVGAAPAALVVVAADDGWSAQSQEHLEILDLLEVPILLAVVTKADAVAPTRMTEVVTDVDRRLAASGRESVPVVGADGLSGRGVDEVAARLAAALARTTTPPEQARARLWVDRAFTVAGAGMVVTGTLQHGRIGVGDPAVLLPSGRRARVRGLQCLGEPVEQARPGSRVAVNLAGVARDDVGRGDAVVVGPAPEWPTMDAFDALVRVVPGATVDTRGAWRLHVGTAVVEARLHPVLGEPVHTTGYVRVASSAPLPLRCGDRFVLREVGRRQVVGGGEVLVPWASGRLHGTDQRLRRADALDAVARSDGPERVAALLAAGVDQPADQVLVAAGLDPGAEVPQAVRLGGRLVRADDLAAWAGAATEHLSAAGGEGAARADLTAEVTAAGCPAGLADAVVDHLVDHGRLAAVGPVLLHPDHRQAHERRSTERSRQLLDRLQAAPWSPPALPDLVRETGVTSAELQALVDRGEVVVHHGIGFAAEALAGAVARLADLEREHGPFTAAAARETLATSRRYVIPLLELLDSRGVTTFDGRLRQLRRTTWP